MTGFISSAVDVTTPGLLSCSGYFVYDNAWCGVSPVAYILHPPSLSDHMFNLPCEVKKTQVYVYISNLNNARFHWFGRIRIADERSIWMHEAHLCVPLPITRPLIITHCLFSDTKQCLHELLPTLKSELFFQFFISSHERCVFVF